MSSTVRAVECCARRTRRSTRVLLSAWIVSTVTAAAIARAEPPQGDIVAWGDNSYGQTSVPAPNSGYVGLAAGGYHSLGLKADGSVVAWGCGIPKYNYGQCNVPAPNTGFIAAAGGGYHSLALKADGSIVAWGLNAQGQTNVPAPNTGFVGVAAGGLHSLGLKADGSIVAWGLNDFGQTNVPAPNSGFVAVAAGWRHGLGLKPDGSIVAWGANYYGQTNVPSPNAGFVGIAAGGNHSLGLRADGSIVAWGCETGANAGQCNVPAPNNGFIGVAAGGYHSLGLKADGSIVAWGCADWPGLTNDFGQCNVPTPNSGFVAVAAGIFHSLAIRRGPPPTQSIVLDFDDNAQFEPARDLYPLLDGLIHCIPGHTPRLNQNDPELLALFATEGHARTWEDFKQDILRRVEAAYCGYRVEFVLSDNQASLLASHRSHVYFSGPRHDYLLGNSCTVDRCNSDHQDSALVFLSCSLFPSCSNTTNFTYTDLIKSTSWAVVHEVGHLLGLQHTEPEQAQQYMYYAYTYTDRSFVGLPLQLREAFVPATQNDRFALDRDVGSVFPPDYLRDAGTIDTNCDLVVAGLQLHVTADMYDVHLLLSNGSDAGRSIHLGDFVDGSVVAARVAINPGERLAVVGSSLPRTVAGGAGEGASDVLAYFGVPSDDRVESLDPALVTLSAESLGPSIHPFKASLLRIQDTTFTIGGEIAGQTSSASDFNQDGQIDGLDLSRLTGCLSGPAESPGLGCAATDLTLDGYVDLLDVSQFITTHSAYAH